MSINLDKKQDWYGAPPFSMEQVLALKTAADVRKFFLPYWVVEANALIQDALDHGLPMNMFDGKMNDWDEWLYVLCEGWDDDFAQERCDIIKKHLESLEFEAEPILAEGKHFMANKFKTTVKFLFEDVPEAPVLIEDLYKMVCEKVVALPS